MPKFLQCCPAKKPIILAQMIFFFKKEAVSAHSFHISRHAKKNFVLSSGIRKISGLLLRRFLWKIFSLYLIQIVSCRFRSLSSLFTGFFSAVFSMSASTASRLGKVSFFRRVHAQNAATKSLGMRIFLFSAGYFCAENAPAAVKKYRSSTR